MWCTDPGRIILLYFLLIIFGAICMLMQKISDLVRMIIPIVSFTENELKIIYSEMRNNKSDNEYNIDLESNTNTSIDKISESN